MGLTQSNLKKSYNVTLIGLDEAGKSSLISRLKNGMVMDTLPTVGFNVCSLELDRTPPLTVWDVGGQKSMRPYWRYYLEDCSVLVFVVDSSDMSRMHEAKKALKMILANEHMEGVPLMVLANKKDLPNSMTIREVSTLLELPSNKDRDWEIQACSARQGLGLVQAFTSIAELVKKN